MPTQQKVRSGSKTEPRRARSFTEEELNASGAGLPPCCFVPSVVSGFDGSRSQEPDASGEQTMQNPRHSASYNQRIPHMQSRSASGSRLGWLTSLLLAMVLLPSSLSASILGDTARQLAHKIATSSGPGAIAAGRALEPAIRAGHACPAGSIRSVRAKHRGDRRRFSAGRKRRPRVRPCGRAMEPTLARRVWSPTIPSSAARDDRRRFAPNHVAEPGFDRFS